MFRVVSSNSVPGHLTRLREWFLAEWGAVDSFEGRGKEIAVPPPLLAISDSELLGGLMFSAFRQPAGDDLGLWINALFVAPDHRRKGIASRLIRAAEAEAVSAGWRQIFALTDIPELYQNLGWQCIESSHEGTVVGAALDT
jgi:GNAT superfamily N-acetyltransferase